MSPDGHKVIFQRPGGANPTLFYALDADTVCDTTKPVISLGSGAQPPDGGLNATLHSQKSNWALTFAKRAGSTSVGVR